MRITDRLCEIVDEELVRNPFTPDGCDYEVFVAPVVGPTGQPTFFAHFMVSCPNPLLGQPPVMVASPLPLEVALSGDLPSGIKAMVDKLVEFRSQILATGKGHG